MTKLLDVSRDELPPVVEHLEAVVAGMWVRTKVGAVHRDPVSDRMSLQSLLSAGRAQDELRDQLQLATSLRPSVDQLQTPVTNIITARMIRP
jgi:hypothetical protein